MKFLRNAIIALLIVAVIVGAFLFLYISTFVEWAARKAINFVAVHLAAQGIELRDPDFNSVGVGLPLSVWLRGFSAHFVMTKHNVFQIDRNFSLDIEKVTVSVRGIRSRTFVLVISNALVRLQPETTAGYMSKSDAKKQEDYDRLEVARLEVPFRIRSLKKAEIIADLRQVIKDVADLAKFGYTTVPMRLNGASAFVIRKKPVSGRMLLIPEGKGYKFVMDKDDFKKLSEVLGERLTEAEYDVYCNNPLRLPRMLRIRNYASDEAYKAHQKDPEVPEEAYKHILWGYLLAKAYDEKFSAETTDSHEIGALGGEYAVRTYLAEERGISAADQAKEGAKEKSMAASQMDLVNNAIGREYAKRGYTENSLADRVKTDSRVVRDPSEIELDVSRAIIPQ